jgi:hypothetical protein
MLPLEFPNCLIAVSPPNPYCFPSILSPLLLLTYLVSETPSNLGSTMRIHARPLHASAAASRCDESGDETDPR